MRQVVVCAIPASFHFGLFEEVLELFEQLAGRTQVQNVPKKYDTNYTANNHFHCEVIALTLEELCRRGSGRSRGAAASRQRRPVLGSQWRQEPSLCVHDKFKRDYEMNANLEKNENELECAIVVHECFELRFFAYA